jgi:NAD(P)-dependent dehydrogenase (short-subunit alcohol dehydrogenase family)
VISRSPTRWPRRLQQLESLGTQALGISADVRQPQALERAFATAAERFGPSTCWCPAPPATSSPARRHVAQRLQDGGGHRPAGSFNVARLAHAHLRKPGACVIQISAGQAFIPTPFQAHVCAAKAWRRHADAGAGARMGRARHPHQLHRAGPIADTEGLKRLAPTDATMAAMAQRVPLKRLGRIEDISRMAMLLASDWGSYITGRDHPVDGGLALTGRATSRRPRRPRSGSRHDAVHTNSPQRPQRHVPFSEHLGCASSGPKAATRW